MGRSQSGRPKTTGRFSKSSGNYRAVTQAVELEFVPVRNLRVELGTALAFHDINGVLDFEDLRQVKLQGASVDLRYRFLDRDTAPVGLTFGIETYAYRVDENTAALVRNYGTEFTLAFDKELVLNRVVAALNFLYQPEWTRLVTSNVIQQESTIGIAAAVMAQVRPGFFIGAEAHYLRTYEGLGLDAFEGDALFVGPTVFVRLTERSRLTAAWSFQTWGRSTGATSSLNLVDFERHQARLVFGVKF